MRGETYSLICCVNAVGVVGFMLVDGPVTANEVRHFFEHCVVCSALMTCAGGEASCALAILVGVGHARTIRSC